MNYGTFTGLTFTNGKRIMPSEILDLVDEGKCQRMDHPSMDGTGWLCWEDGETLTHSSITSVLSTSQDGEKIWLQQQLDHDQSNLDFEVLIGQYEDETKQAEFAAGIAAEQVLIDARQVVITAM